MGNVIIIPSIYDWDWMTQRPQQLAKQFAQNGFSVFYFNHTITNESVTKVKEGLFVVHNFPKWIKEHLHKLKKENNVGIWCSWPQKADFIKQLEVNWVVFDYIDDFKQWYQYEKRMVEISHLLTCTSEALHKRLKRLYPNKTVELVRNAYDPDLQLHGDINRKGKLNSSKRKIGYVGAWAPWIDLELIKKLLKEDVELFVIGPEFGLSTNRIKSTNIHFLGRKKHSELKEYMSECDMFIIPFKINALTVATNPVKAYEYLATGKPVVSTDLPECRMMSPLIDVAKSHEEFINVVCNRPLVDGSNGERISFALNNTWENRLNQIIILLQKQGVLKQ
ncbi:glycosyltransferase [Bacillus kexueae]|uniref:glycosyltransferase n=1 Tax=Aeribacillus kexueae TaxID=2078952 RepID=UPI001FAF80A0|nr:glycosyltransferase [Bacillus kexueae]